jgi:cell division protein FtsZ
MAIEFVDNAVQGGRIRFVDVGGMEIEQDAPQEARIIVVGTGGGGGNALDNMIVSGLTGVHFIGINTDAQALQQNQAPIKIQLGRNITRGLGCGGDPEAGRKSAMADRDRIREALDRADMVFVTAGMGGGTGTGAAPIIAEVARGCGALTVGVVTSPFDFEGKMRMRQADEGIDRLKRSVDTLITIPNQKLLSLVEKATPMSDAFKKADEVLHNAVKGISDTITFQGFINLDFADVRTIMSEKGMALMGQGVGTGRNRAVDAAQMAISSPLLDDVSIEGARGILVNVTANKDLSLFEVHEAISLIQDGTRTDSNLIFGVVIDESQEEEVRFTVIATGIGGAGKLIDQEKKAAKLKPVPVVREELEMTEDYDVPTILRNRRGIGPSWLSNTGGGSNRSPVTTLDEPAFLRQASRNDSY